MGRLPLAESNRLLEHSVRVDAHLSLALMPLEGCRSTRNQSSPGTFSRRSIAGICSRPLDSGRVRLRLDHKSSRRSLHVLSFAHTVSALLRVEFPRPAALLQSISAGTRLRSPASDFERRAQTPARRNPPPDPPKMLLRRLPSARLGLGVATSRSGPPATDGHERKEHEPESR